MAGIGKWSLSESPFGKAKYETKTASQLASGGASLPLIGALLGHASPATTQRYAHLHDDPMRAAVEKVGAVIVNAGKDVEATNVEAFPKRHRPSRT